MKRLLLVTVLILLAQCVFAGRLGHVHLKGPWHCYAFSDELNKSLYDYPSGKVYIFIDDDKIINYADKKTNGIYKIASSDINYVGKKKFIYIHFVGHKEWWLIEEGCISKDSLLLSIISGDNKIIYNILLGRPLKLDSNTF